MKDQETTFAEMKETLRRFNEARNWKHPVLNTAVSISLEAAELLEIFQWHDRAGAEKAARETDREHFMEELADVMIYCMDLAISCDVDIAAAMEDKLRKNACKYPVKEE